MLRVAILAASLFLVTSASALTVVVQPLQALPPQPADAPWPTSEWATAPLSTDVDQASLDLALTEVINVHHRDLGETRAVLIVQGGRIVLERYSDGFTRDSRLISWSMAKSITQALVGAAVLQGRVNPDAPMGNPHWRATDRRAQIPWRQWMQMVDGQPWSETQARGVLDNDSARMLYGEGRNDTAAFGASRPLLHNPGAHWNYNSGGVAMVADALTRTIVPNPRDAADRRDRMRAWMDQSLFAPIGMHPIVQFDPSGTFYGSAEIYASARDFARFGLLYLRDGVWNGRRLLPEGWVDFARTPNGADTDIYGAGFWLTPGRGDGHPMRALFTDDRLASAFSAQGHEGQLTIVVPSKDLVVVRLGRFDADTGARWNALGDWLQRVVLCFPDRPSTRLASR